jgi:benzodiazapine receptor
LSYYSSFYAPKNISTWYCFLKRPNWDPPTWLFLPLWYFLHVILGLSAWYIWLEGGFVRQWYPLILFALTILLTFIWTTLFFGFHALATCCLEITFLWVSHQNDLCNDLMRIEKLIYVSFIIRD